MPNLQTTNQYWKCIYVSEGSGTVEPPIGPIGLYKCNFYFLITCQQKRFVFLKIDPPLFQYQRESRQHTVYILADINHQGLVSLICRPGFDSRSNQYFS